MEIHKPNWEKAKTCNLFKPRVVDGKFNVPSITLTHHLWANEDVWLLNATFDQEIKISDMVLKMFHSFNPEQYFPWIAWFEHNLHVQDFNESTHQYLVKVVGKSTYQLLNWNINVRFRSICCSHNNFLCLRDERDKKSVGGENW